MRLCLITVALAFGLPAASLAEGCRDEARMSCAEGTVWDVEKQICAPKPTS